MREMGFENKHFRIFIDAAPLKELADDKKKPLAFDFRIFIDAAPLKEGKTEDGRYLRPIFDFRIFIDAAPLKVPCCRRLH